MSWVKCHDRNLTFHRVSSRRTSGPEIRTGVVHRGRRRRRRESHPRDGLGSPITFCRTHSGYEVIHYTHRTPYRAPNATCQSLLASDQTGESFRKGGLPAEIGHSKV